MNKEILIRATKEFFRVVVLAIIPILIANLSDSIFNWKVIAITGGIAGLKFIDKLLHEIGTAREAEGTKKNPIVSELTTGLTRF